MEIGDHEIAGMRELYCILKGFDRDAQERMTVYVIARLTAEALREIETERASWKPPKTDVNYMQGRL